jgi:hypothetical protein
MITINLGLKEYVKTGETVFLTNDKNEDLGHAPARVRGWGRYALVEVGAFTIRRDSITKNEKGDWCYRFYSVPKQS